MAAQTQNNGDFSICHSLSFTGLKSESMEETLLELRNIPGMISVKNKGDKLTFCYDASKCQLKQCLKLLESWHISPKPSWWNNLKLSWAQQTDQNIWNNARHVPHCCSKPPEQGRIKR